MRDQMGHSSIQITADKYVHSISGRNVGFVDQLEPRNNQEPRRLEADNGEGSEKENQLQVVEGEAWCERGESNPHGFPRQILSLVRLPISPLSHLYIQPFSNCLPARWGHCSGYCSGYLFRTCYESQSLQVPDVRVVLQHFVRDVTRKCHNLLEKTPGKSAPPL